MDECDACGAETDKTYSHERGKVCLACYRRGIRRALALFERAIREALPDKLGDEGRPKP